MSRVMNDNYTIYQKYKARELEDDTNSMHKIKQEPLRIIYIIVNISTVGD